MVLSGKELGAQPSNFAKYLTPIKLNLLIFLLNLKFTHREAHLLAMKTK